MTEKYMQQKNKQKNPYKQRLLSTSMHHLQQCMNYTNGPVKPTFHKPGSTTAMYQHPVCSGITMFCAYHKISNNCAPTFPSGELKEAGYKAG